MGPSPLRGVRVLVPRPEPDPVADAVRAAGGTPLGTELVRTTATDPAELDAGLRDLAAGELDWLAVTSARTVAVLAARAHRLDAPLTRLTGPAYVAAVGPATARAMEEEGVAVDLCPTGTSSATDLLTLWPAPPPGGSVLLPRSAIAAPTLAHGLQDRGWRVRDIVAYRTETAPVPDPAVVDALADGAVDVVLLTSGSTAVALVELYGHPGAPVCAIGASTARTATRLGLTVAAVAREQSPAGLVAAAVTAVAPPSARA